MSAIPEHFERSLSAAHAEALRVGDSPLRADQLAAKLSTLLSAIPQDLSDDVRRHLEEALTQAQRTLRRDDDGKQAARYLKEATRLTEERTHGPRKAPWE